MFQKRIGTLVLSNMKKLIIPLVILLTVVAILLSTRMPASKSLKSIKIGSTQMNVEVVSSPESLSKGLSDRSSIGSDGMLFVLPVREVPSFWMKDMRFGLDFVWIDYDRVVAINENISAPKSSDTSLEIISPKVPATHVLELPLGDVAKRSIKVGDKLEF